MLILNDWSGASTSLGADWIKGPRSRARDESPGAFLPHRAFIGLDSRATSMVGRSVLGFDTLVFPIRPFTIRTIGDRSPMILVSRYRAPSGDNSPKLGSVASDATFYLRFY